MKTPTNSTYFNRNRTIALPSFLKEHIKKKSNNISRYVKDLLQDYYKIIEENSLDEDVEKVFISISISPDQQNKLVNMVNVSPHVSACDLIRTMLWLDFIRDKELRQTKEPYPVPKNFVRVPLEEDFIDYRLVGEA